MRLRDRRKVRAQSAPVDSGRAARAASEQAHIAIPRLHGSRRSNVATPRLGLISEYEYS